MRARQDNTGVLVRLVAAGELEIALGFCAEPAAGVERAVVREERAVLAVGEQHPLARRDAVALADLAGETFALVDAQDGAGYNAAVREHCRAAGFEPRAAADPHGPLAWETAVRLHGCVGLTTRASARRRRRACGCCGSSRRSRSRSTCSPARRSARPRGRSRPSCSK